MYAVKGFPSTSTSTRRWSSWGTTSTRGLGAGDSGFGTSEPRTPNPEPRSTRTKNNHTVRMSASAHHNVAFGVVEHHLPAAVHRGDGHAQRHGVVVARLDVGVGLLARAHAFHPVLHVGGGGRIGARVRRGL